MPSTEDIGAIGAGPALRAQIVLSGKVGPASDLDLNERLMPEGWCGCSENRQELGLD